MLLINYLAFGLPVSLALIMFNMGLLLRLADFQLVVSQPRAFITGLTAQMLVVPLIALLLLQIFTLSPELAIGLLILSFSPGGVTSNLFSHLARGDIALSVSLTATASFITPFTIPLLCELTLQMYQFGYQKIDLAVGLTIMRLLMITVLPILAGMLWCHLSSVSAAKIQPWIQRLSILIFLSVIAGIVNQHWNTMPYFLSQVGDVTIVMIIATMMSGYLLAKTFRLDQYQTRSISIEVGIQNAGMALVVSQTMLQNANMSIIPIIYGLLMLIPVLIFTLFSRRETAAAD